MRLFIDPKFFPTVMIVLQLGAAIVWFYAGDRRKCLYWLAAAVLTFAVTY